MLMKTLFPIAFLFFLLLVGPAGRSLAQSGKIQFEHLTIEQGLSHNLVIAMMQDRKGYLWFGTGNGLNKYDGYRFTHYEFDPHDQASLPKNQVISLWEDQDGIIWVGTAESTCRFNPRTEKFTRLEKSAANPYAFKYAQAFNEDREGNLWVAGSFEGELRQIDRKTGKFSATNYAAMLGADSSSKYTQNPYTLFKDKSGTLWIGNSTGLHRLHLLPQQGGKASKVSFTHYRHQPTNPSSLSHNRVAGIFEDHRGILWVITMQGTLNAFDRESGRFTHYPLETDKTVFLNNTLETKIMEDQAGNLWFGTFNGLYKLDKERQKFTTYRHNPIDLKGLTNDAIYDILVDQAGILWVATIEGLDKLDPRRKPFGLYRHDPANPGSLSTNQITAICEDQAGTVWVGTKGGGLNALNKTTGQFTHYRHDAQDATSLRSDEVGAVLEDRNDALWVGNGQVLSRLDRKSGKFRHFPLIHPFLLNPVSSPIFTICQVRDGTFWLGTSNGIINFDPGTAKSVHYPYDPDHPERISDWWALAILEDSKGNLWIGPGSQALTRFDRKTGTFTQYKTHQHSPGSIPSHTVSSIYEDSKGNLWFGTGEGGLCRFDHATETFTTYSKKQGLAGNAVFSILEDNEGNLWLGTNNGLSRFSSDNQTFTNYTADDGLQSNFFAAIYTEGAAFKGKDGTLYFGGNSGLNAFKPVAIRSNTYVPPVVITRFTLFDKPMPGKHEAREVELDYDENFFSIEFAALNYTSSHKNRYVYQLEGVDKDWVYSGSRRQASYTDIGYGRYVFRVKGSNNDNIWNDKPTTFTIIIRPPFWKTWWAYIGYAALFLAGLLLARREVVRQERLKANLKVKQVESAKLRELDTMKSHFFANISHEFRTPLALIQGSVEKLKMQHPLPQAQAGFKLIERNTRRLLELINQLLDLSRLEAGKLALHLEPGELHGFLTVLAASFTSLYQSKQITYQYQLPDDPVYVLFDRDKLEKILTNLLANAFKFTPPHGKVRFTGRIQEKDETHCSLQVTLQDTGVGIPEKQLSRIFDRFHQVDPSATRSYEGTGIGLALVKELVDLHGGRIDVESREGIGTTFSLLLPFQLTAAPPGDPEGQEKDLTPPAAAHLPELESSEPCPTSNPVAETAIQILVVEDNTELRCFISEQLSQHYRVSEAQNGLQGYRQALETGPDLVISDVMMPEMDGVALCEKLKTDERTSHIPIILLTAKADLESKLEGLQTGADDYLTKPFKLEELQVRIHNLLENRRKLRERFSRQITLNPKEITVTSTDERFLQKALSVVEAHMANAEFDVETFSKEIGMSRAQLHRKLTALSGLSANEFIRSLRLKRAASLLLQHQGNVSEVAYQVGYSSLNYFTKCFRDFHGQTPTEYLRSHPPAAMSRG